MAGVRRYVHTVCRTTPVDADVPVCSARQPLAPSDRKDPANAPYLGVGASARPSLVDCSDRVHKVAAEMGYTQTRGAVMTPKQPTRQVDLRSILSYHSGTQGHVHWLAAHGLSSPPLRSPNASGAEPGFDMVVTRSPWP
jgi:hypothetical protein